MNIQESIDELLLTVQAMESTGSVSDEILKKLKAFLLNYFTLESHHHDLEKITGITEILTKIGVDRETAAAAILLTILKDNSSYQESVDELFDESLSVMISNVQKVFQYNYQSNQDHFAENFRRMLLATAEDIRVIFIILADRLLTMRLLKKIPQIDKISYAKETLDIFAPIANRLGMGKMKVELEDLGLKFSQSEIFYEIKDAIAQRKKVRDENIKKTLLKLTAQLKEASIKATISGRSKHFYSIYKKMIRQNKKIDHLYDLTAVRIIVHSVKKCYEVLGMIHASYKPIQGTFKDYIAMPKVNMYQSLHTSVIGLDNKPLEVQIRTQEMHDLAEFGIAAHWKYKESGSQKASSDDDKKFTWLRKLVDLKNDVAGSDEYLESVKLNLFTDEVFVFTPQGDVISLPVGATPIDFAYRVHTSVGNRCSGALVNNSIVSIDYRLKNGDIVEVLTNKQENPNLDWLKIVATHQAKSRIRQWYRKHHKEKYVDQGRSALETELTKSKVEQHLRDGKLLEIAKDMNFNGEDELFASIGYGEISIQKVTNKLQDHLPQKAKVKQFSTDSKSRNVSTLGDILHFIAKCCTPLPGEPIIGVITKGRGVSIHKEECPNLVQIPEERLLSIQWGDKKQNTHHISKLRIEAIDRLGVLKDILTRISDQNADVVYVNTKKDKRYAQIEIGIEIEDIHHLDAVLKSIKNMSDVHFVKRLINT